MAHGFPRGADDLAGAFLLDLARGQQALGHEIAAVVPHDAGLPVDDRLDGVAIRRFRYGRDEDETLAYRGTMAEQVLRSWSARWRFVRFIAAMRRAVARAVQEWRPDVVHVHWWFPGGLAVWPGQLPVPVVITSHGTDLFLADRSAALRALASRILPAAQAVTVISSPLAERARGLGVRADRITVVPMPVRATATSGVAAAAPARVPGRVLFLGRLVARKGAAVAIDALPALRAQVPSATLRIVGEGPERAALEAQVQRLALTDAVTFVGAVAPSDVAAEYATASAFVMPAITDWKGEQEGFGLVLVEAMRAGLPVVASRSGGIPDIVSDSITGRLVPERDSGALASALAETLLDPDRARAMAERAAQDVAQRFAPESIARVFDTVYRRAVA